MRGSRALDLGIHEEKKKNSTHIPSFRATNFFELEDWGARHGLETESDGTGQVVSILGCHGVPSETREQRHDFTSDADALVVLPSFFSTLQAKWYSVGRENGRLQASTRYGMRER